MFQAGAVTECAAASLSFRYPSFSITQLVGQKGNNKVSKCKLKKILIWE